MKKLPRVSIVMLNYNGLDYLKETIPQIINFSYPNYEVLLVDNGSVDGSIEFISSFKKIKLVKSPVIRAKNFACNYGIKKSKGDYILLMDNDAYIKDKKIIQKLLKRYNSKIGAIGLSFYEKGYKKSKSYGGYFDYSFIKANKFIEFSEIKKYDNKIIGFPEGKALFISKKRWEDIGWYDEHLIFGGCDTDLGMKLSLFGYQNKLFSETIQVHLGLSERKDNQKYFLKFKEMVYAEPYTILKNYSFRNLFISLFCNFVFSFLKSLKQSVQRFSIGPFISFTSGYLLFIKNVPVALEKRKEIQKNRTIKEDTFLKIKP